MISNKKSEKTETHDEDSEDTLTPEIGDEVLKRMLETPPDPRKGTKGDEP